MSAWMLVAIGTLAVFLVMTALWLLGIRNKNFSFVDVGWSANFTLLAVIYAALAGGWPTRKWVIAAMFSLWSLRLAGHLAKRIIGEPEEGRYVELRRKWANNLYPMFFGFFQLQAALNVILVLPLLIACLNPEPRLHLLEVIGV